jgi:hypothetical protein
MIMTRTISYAISLSALVLALSHGIGAAGPSTSSAPGSTVAAQRAPFDQISESAPRSSFDQLADSAPRSVFADLRAAAPRSAEGLSPVEFNTP